MYTIFVQFKSYVENMLSIKIKALRIDNRGEYTSLEFKNYLLTHGIHHKFTCLHTSEQNGVSKRKHRYVLDLSRVCFSYSYVPCLYWNLVLYCSIFLIYRLSIKYLNNVSPYEFFFVKSPSYSSLGIFGCEYYPRLKPYTTSKL